MMKLYSVTWRQYYGPRPSEYDYRFIHYNLQVASNARREFWRICRDVRKFYRKTGDDFLLYFSDLENLQKVAEHTRFCRHYERSFYVRIRNPEEYRSYKKLGVKGKLVVRLEDLESLSDVGEEILLQVDQVCSLPMERVHVLLMQYRIFEVLLGQICYLGEQDRKQLQVLEKMFPQEKGNQKALERNNKITGDMYDLGTYGQLVGMLEALAAPLRNLDKETAVEELKKYLASSMHYDEKERFPESFLPENHTLTGYLFNGACVCEGIAKVFHQLCGLLGISSEVKAGYRNGQGHIWNRVRIDGTWQDVDVTTYYYEHYYQK